jgi:hypothetical protein
MEMTFNSRPSVRSIGNENSESECRGSRGSQRSFPALSVKSNEERDSINMGNSMGNSKEEFLKTSFFGG